MIQKPLFEGKMAEDAMNYVAGGILNSIYWFIIINICRCINVSNSFMPTFTRGL